MSLDMMENTIWFGCCKPRISALKLRHRAYTQPTDQCLSVWGWLPNHYTLELRDYQADFIKKRRVSYKKKFDSARLLGKRSRKHQPSTGIAGFDTVWFRTKSTGHLKLIGGVELFTSTIWGRVQLWDGRLRSSSTWVEPSVNENRRKEPEDEAQTLLDYIISHANDADD